jgi:capsular exopolysaccharide synthesis family protein
LALLWRKKWALIAWSLAGLLAGFVAVLFQPALYHARTTLELQSLNERFMNMTEVDPQAGAGNYAATDSNLQTQIKILTSDYLRARALDKVERETVPLAPEQGDLFAVLRSRFKLVPAEPAEATRLALRQAAKTLDAGVVRSTRIVEVRCDSGSAEVAANLVNTIASEYIDQATEARAKSAEKTHQWLSLKLADLKTRLEESENRLQSYVRSAGLQFVEQQNTLADAKLKQLQTELSTIQADRIAKQARYEMATKSSPESLPDVLDDSTLRGYQVNLTDLRRQRAELLAILMPGHAKVRQVDAQIKEVETAEKKTRDSVLQRIRNDYESALRREKLLDSAYGGQSHNVAAQEERELEYNILKREAEVNRQMYNTTLEQANQAELAAGIPNNNIRVLDTATAPILPYRPVPLFDMGTGLGTGLLLGSALIVYRGRADRSLRMPGHASQLLHAPEIAVIPAALFSPVRRRFSGIRSRRMRREPSFVELATLRHNPALLAESFRVCLPTLLERNPGRPIRLIVVTSPAPGEGKTTCAANLAIAVAETNRRVLLVDGDFRSPCLHKIFGVPQSIGLAGINDSTQPIERFPLETVVQPTEVPGLFVLPVDEAPVNISRLHYSPRIRKLLERFRTEYDLVIIDTPPMLQFFDARALAQLSDGVVLVFRSGSTERASVVAAGQRLEQDGIPLLGTILNDWDPKTAESKTYHRYYKHAYRNAG